MTYILTEFATVTLPAKMPVEDIGTGRAVTKPMQLPGGGAFDPLRDSDAVVGLEKIDKEALIHSATASVRVSEYRDLRALLGTRGRLYRLWDGESLSQWVDARLVQVTSRRSVKEYKHLNVRMSFEKYSSYWRSDPEDLWYFDSGEDFDTGLFFDGETMEWYFDDGEYFDDGLFFDRIALIYRLNVSPKTVTITNSGNTDVTDAEIRIDAGSANITALEIRITGRIELDYTGTITAGQELIIDCGAYSVLNNGSNDRANFSVGSTHSINEWFRVRPGGEDVIVAITGGSTDSTITFAYANAHK